MRFKHINFCLFIFVAITLVGCDNYLGVTPDERPTQEDAFENPQEAEDFLYSCYAPMPNKRKGTTSLDLLTADEVATAFEHETFAQFPRGQFTPSNPVISYWNTLYEGIRQSHILIKNVGDVPGLSESLKAEYKAEARFLVAYYHFLLARMYGPVIVQEQVPPVEVPAAEYPARSSYEETVNFIVDMLDKASTDLPATRTGNEYGRATSVIAKSIKSRVLLYAASPLFNGGGKNNSSFYEAFTNPDGTQLIPTEYDPEKWKRAAEASREAIDAAESAGFSLYREGENAEGAGAIDDPVEKDLRYTFVDPNSSEIIWAETRQEGPYDFQNKSTPFHAGTSWNGLSPTLTILESFYTENGLPISKDPDFDYEDRYSIVESPNGMTMKLNMNREPRFEAWIGYHNSYYEVRNSEDGKNRILVKFRKDDNAGIKDRSNNYSPTGYLNKKGVHPATDITSFSITQNYPWPKIRLAELYLNYAEALIEYGQDFETAKSYINKVRDRAGIPSIDEAWKPVGGANSQKTLRDIVRQERTNEFYLENHRFWDIRRWMTAEEYLDGPLKGLNYQGETNEEFFQVSDVPFPRKFISPAHYLMPIPIAEVNRNPQLVQNPGY